MHKNGEIYCFKPRKYISTHSSIQVDPALNSICAAEIVLHHEQVVSQNFGQKMKKDI